MSLDPTPATVESDIRTALPAIIKIVVGANREVAGFVLTIAPHEYSGFISITQRLGQPNNRGQPFYDVDYNVTCLYRLNELKAPVEIAADVIARDITFELLQRRMLQVSAALYPRGVPGIRDEGLTQVQTRVVIDGAENAQKKIMAVETTLLIPTRFQIEQLRY